MKLIDSHAHLDLEKQDRSEMQAMLDRAWDSGLEAIVAMAGAARPAEFDDTFRIAEAERRIWVAAGIHPHISSGATPDALDKLRFALDRQKVVALGEIGLDYHYNRSPPQDQRRAFIRQIRMAHEAQKPIVVHTREADHDTLAILGDEGAEKVGGVIHCFSSNAGFAAAAVDLGFFISFSGIVTFPKAAEVQEVAAQVPEDRILAETDTPFLSPVPFRGRWPNEPARVAHVVQKLADLREVEPEVMAALTAKNTRRCFGLHEKEEVL